MNEEVNIDCVGDLPPNVIVHDMSFDWTGRRLAAACSDKILRMFTKKAEKWIDDGVIKIQGASAWKVKWARPEFGTIIATCSLDTHIRIFEMKKTDKGEGEKNDWSEIHYHPENKAIEDIKFIPSKSYGLCIAIASSDGNLKVLMAPDPLKPKEWSFHCNLQVNELGLSCLSWSKNLIKEEESVLAVGCKSIETSPKRVVSGMKTFSYNGEPEREIFETTNTVAFVNFSRNLAKPLERISVPGIKEKEAINDISWALMNGRSYHLLAIAADTFIKVFEINIKEASKDVTTVDILKTIQLSSESCMRLSWNIMGTYLSASEKKKIRIWRCISRGVWTVLEGIEA